MVAEKPSLAQSIAKILSKGGCGFIAMLSAKKWKERRKETPTGESNVMGSLCGRILSLY